MELRRFLDRNQITFRWVLPDAPDAEEKWGGPLPGDGDCPAIRVIGGKTVVRPKHRRVAELSGLAHEANGAEYDAVIVGAGPPGLAAAVHSASEGPRDDRDRAAGPGRPAGTSSRIENYLGFPSGVSGDELRSRALQQARRLGAEILVTRSITHRHVTRQVHLDGGDLLRARRSSLPAASPGGTFRSTASTGSWGRASPTARPAARRRTLTAWTSTSWARATRRGRRPSSSRITPRSVTILCRGESLEKSMSRYLFDQLSTRPNIRWLLKTEVVCAHGDVSLEAIDVRNGTRRDDAARVGRAFPLHRRGRRDRSGCRRRSRSMTTATSSPARTSARSTLGPRARPVPARDERSRDLRRRRRPLEPGQARRRSRR